MSKQTDAKQMYVQYSKKITSACLLAFFCIVTGIVSIIAFGQMNGVQIEAMVNILQMVSVFETGVIASYATNSIFEKNFAAKYGEIRTAYEVTKSEISVTDEIVEDNG